MLEISPDDVLNRLEMNNPWWVDSGKIPYVNDPKRDYFDKFFQLVTERKIKRATIMMGPRRVGKTVILYQTIGKLIEIGIDPQKILYVSMDTPVYVGLSLEKFVTLFQQRNSLDNTSETYVIYDEIQYLKDWEVHLKDLVDHYPHIKFIASGSAAAALKLKSQESGAGRFTNFMLPPLTFAEYLHFSGIEEDLIIQDPLDPKKDETGDIAALNQAFIDYINHGGYPEVVINPAIKSASKRYVKEDIIDKVLLRDLPSLYGINDIQEMNRLFTVLAYNTGNEVSPEELSQSSGVPKHLLQKYLDYLEAAFLIVRVSKINESGKHFKRQRQFKVYLTNPSMRAALFKPVKDDDPAMGALAETAIFSQWFHSPEMDLIRYARWSSGVGGEVDIVKLGADLKPVWAYEIKWSNAYFEQPKKLKSLIKFTKMNKQESISIGATTKTVSGKREVQGITIRFFPCSLHCYQIGRRVTLNR